MSLSPEFIHNANIALGAFFGLSSISLGFQVASRWNKRVETPSRFIFGATAASYILLIAILINSSFSADMLLGSFLLLASPFATFFAMLLFMAGIYSNGVIEKVKWIIGSVFSILVIEWCVSATAISERAFWMTSVFVASIFLKFINHQKEIGQQRAKVTANAAAETEKEDSPASLFPARAPRFNFAQVQGMDALKAKLNKARVEMTTEGKNGVLFSGEPGNGKTFIAEAFAGEIKANFLEIRIGDLASRWVNQTTEQVKAAFDAARAQAPCVIFLDEVDSALRDRAQTMGMGDGEAPRLTNALLTLLADMRSHPEYGVTVVAATNHLDHLDPAAIREGRFDFKIEIPAPDYAARLGLLNTNISKGVSFDGDAAERAARRWEGFNVARMKEVANRASKLAIELGMNKITFKMLGQALRDVQGSLGGKLPENTPNLDQLRFNESMCDNLKILANRMIDIERIEAMGGTVPKAVLFHGPAGTGKTAVSKALAISSKWAFLSTTGQALLNDPAELDKLVKKANDLRPCIVFIDEADDILADRATNPYGKQATNKLLAVLDGVIPLHDVMFVAATNFPEGLDAAAVRGGRFAEAYEFELPGKNATTALIADFMAAKSMAPWGADFTPESAAPLLSGLAPADVKDRLQKAINRVAGRGEGRITLDELEKVV